MRAAILLGLALFCLMGALHTSTALPGFKVTLSQTGLDYAKQLGINFLQQKFNNFRIANVAGQAKAPVVGTINWELNNIIIKYLNVPGSVLQIIPGTGFDVGIAGAGMEVTMDFKFKQKSFPKIGGSGRLVITIGNTAIGIKTQVGQANGKPSINVFGCTCFIGDLKIKEHGGPSWLYNFFLSVLNGVIKRAVQDAVTANVPGLINDAGNKALQTVPTTEQFGGIAEVDFSLVSAPTFGPNYWTTNTKGEFFYIPQHEEAPFQPPATPDTVTGQMAQVFFTSFVPNTASLVFFKAGKMAGKVVDAQLPAWSPLRLNTSSFKDLIPQLYNLLPNAPMELVLSAAAPPTATFHAQGVTVAGNGLFSVSAIAPNGTTVPVFVVGVSLQTTVKATVTGGRIFPTMSLLNASFSLVESRIGTINLGGLDSALRLICSDIVVPFFNYYLSHGVNIPTVKGIVFNNPSIGYGNDFVYVSTDITYNPSLAMVDEPAIEEPIMIDDPISIDEPIIIDEPTISID